MSRQPNSSAISYAVVADACAELIKRGETPSIRKLRESLGIGSFSTIQPLYHRWQDEQRLSQNAVPDLSESFRQAIVAEIGRATAAVEEKMSEDLSVEKKRLADIQCLLLECETQVEKLKEDLTVNQKTSEQKRLALEKKLTIAEALAEDHAKREQAYRQEVEILRQAVHQAELKTAIAETKLIEFEKQLSRFEQNK